MKRFISKNPPIETPFIWDIFDSLSKARPVKIILSRRTKASFYFIFPFGHEIEIRRFDFFADEIETNFSSFNQYQFRLNPHEFPNE